MVIVIDLEEEAKKAASAPKSTPAAQPASQPALSATGKTTTAKQTSSVTDNSGLQSGTDKASTAATASVKVPSKTVPASKPVNLTVTAPPEATSKAPSAKAGKASTNAAPEATTTAAPEATAKATPKATSKAVPEATTKDSPEVTTKASPKTTAKATPEATTKAAPEVTTKAAPEATTTASSATSGRASTNAATEAITKATPETTAKAAPEATTKAALETTAKAAPETTAKAALEATTTASSATTGKTSSKATTKSPSVTTSRTSSEATIKAPVVSRTTPSAEKPKSGTEIKKKDAKKKSQEKYHDAKKTPAQSSKKGASKNKTQKGTTAHQIRVQDEGTEKHVDPSVEPAKNDVQATDETKTEKAHDQESNYTANMLSGDTSVNTQEVTTKDDADVTSVEHNTLNQILQESVRSFSSSFKTPTVQTWLKNVLAKLKKGGQEASVMEQFGQCKTDEERVVILYNLPVIHEVLNVKEDFEPKNEEYARDLRMEGNVAFQAKKYPEALELYSKSIIKAPCQDSAELSLTLANRSAVFYHMQKYVLCLQDIKQAFRNGYPDHLQYKLYERRGKTSYCLRLKEEAICAFQDSINVLDRANLDQQKLANIKSDLMKQLQKCSKLVSATNLGVKAAKDFNHNHGVVPVIKGIPSNHVPCMGKSLVMKDSPETGRGLYTTCNIEIGEVLIVEKPYASITLQDYNLTHCHHCCNRVTYPLPCRQCSGVVFCSEECLDDAWTNYHYAECKHHSLIQKSDVGLGHLALRTVLQAGHKYLRDYTKRDIKQSNPILVGCNQEGIYNSNDYHSVYNLIGHAADRSSADLFKRTLVAVFLVKCIENTDFFKMFNDDEFDIEEEKVFVGGHILRHMQMLPCNAHEVSELIFKAFRPDMSEPIEVGSAIYSTLSLINHSCDPSVVRYSYGNMCVVRAIRNIPKGTEIFDNYGVLHPVMAKVMRQEKLLAQYYFTCQCYACLCNWPLYEKIRRENPILKCPKCKIGRISIPADNRTSRAICVDCREVLDIQSDLLHLSKSEGFYQGSLAKVLKGEDMEFSLPFLEAHLCLIDRLLIRPWRDYNDCQEAIKQCYGTMANCQVLEEPDADDEELMEAEYRRR